MKSSTTVFVCALSFAISALASNSNANRLARGLPPLPPRRRQPGAKRLTPSSTPFHCDTKKTFCCADLPAMSSAAGKNAISGLGIPSTSCGEHIGTGCVAAIGDSCIIGTPATCCGNLFGLVGIDCTPVAPSASSSSSHSATSSHAGSTAVSSSASRSSASSASVPRSSSASTRRSSSVSASTSHGTNSTSTSSASVPHSSSASTRSSSSASASASHGTNSTSASISRSSISAPSASLSFGPPLVLCGLEQRTQLVFCGAQLRSIVLVRVPCEKFCFGLALAIVGLFVDSQQLYSLVVGPPFFFCKHAHFVGLAVECFYLAWYQLYVCVRVWFAFRVFSVGPPLVLFGLEQRT
ncbi:hypothetical protein B0H17DRAFT_1205649 [Mycena rosella]|uniref:Hydrophobin n=1 Tax=Mycena rosella TaxID=1033263 RepID=A0AAD7D6U9_MYCRO|nr:hypothetical protein B0H17DRAFT_1205649 [Mycena rosella]